MKIKQSLSKNLPFLYCNCAYGGRIKCLIRIIYFAFYCFSLVLPSNSPASGCQKRFSNLCRNRQLVLVSIRWTFRHGECRTHHSAKESLWNCILSTSGWYGTSAHRPHTDIWTAKVRCCHRCKLLKINRINFFFSEWISCITRDTLLLL